MPCYSVYIGVHVFIGKDTVHPLPIGVVVIMDPNLCLNASLSESFWEQFAGKHDLLFLGNKRCWAASVLICKRLVMNGHGVYLHSGILIGFQIRCNVIGISWKILIQ